MRPYWTATITDKRRINKVRRVVIAGAGAIGTQIGLQRAMYGYTVVLYDISLKFWILRRPNQKRMQISAWIASESV